MNVVTRGIRNAFRNSIRTFSIIIILGLSMGLALSMLVSYQAVNKKITAVKSSTGNTITISPAGFRGFGGGSGNPLTSDQINSVKSVAHVVSVTQTLTDRLTTSDTSLQSAVDAGELGQRFAQRSGQTFTPPPDAQGTTRQGESGTASQSGTMSFTPPVNVVGTTDPTNLSSGEGGGTFTLKEGKVFDDTSTDNVAVIGSSLATKNNLTVGSTFTAYNGVTITVIGIFDAGNTFSNNQVIMPLATVQKLSDQANTVTGAIATIDSIGNVAAATTDIQNTLGSDKADVTNAAATAEQVIAPLENIRTISLYSVLGAVAAGSVIILLTMIMIVRERRREIGVLKAIGANNRTVMGQFMTEAVTLTTLGSAVGIIIGVLAANPITKMLVNNSTSNSGPGQTMVRGAGRAFGAFRTNVTDIHAAVGWNIIVYGLLGAIVIAIIGSAVASFFIAKVRPAEVMRAE